MTFTFYTGGGIWKRGSGASLLLFAPGAAGVITYIYYGIMKNGACILSLLTLLLLFAIPAMAQTSPNEPYAAQWKRADSLLAQGLPESARKVVDKVYADAQRTNQGVQILKAQLYYSAH